jgi:hypothetical protein
MEKKNRVCKVDGLKFSWGYIKGVEEFWREPKTVAQWKEAQLYVTDDLTLTNPDAWDGINEFDFIEKKLCKECKKYIKENRK